MSVAARESERYETFRHGNVSKWVAYMKHAAKEISGIEVEDESVRSILATARGFYVEVLEGMPVTKARQGFAGALRVLLSPLTRGSSNRAGE